MKTPFGDIRLADAHAHFFSHRFFTTLAASLPEPPDEADLYSCLGARLPFEFPPTDPAELAKRWAEELDRKQIARCVLIASVPGDEGSVAAAREAFPDRFIPYFMLNPRAPDALDRTKRAFRELGMRGLCLFPAMHHFHVSEPELRPIFEEVGSGNGIVFVHCGELKVGVRDKLGLPSPFDTSYSKAADLRDVAPDFDPLPFVVPHFGGDEFAKLLEVAAECPNIHVDTSSSNSWMERQSVPLTLERVFERALERLGVERILYGSDSSFFPRGFNADHLRSQLAVLAELDIGATQASLILGGNLERLLERSR